MNTLKSIQKQLKTVGDS